jgi:hypothetical protein
MRYFFPVKNEQNDLEASDGLTDRAVPPVMGEESKISKG